MRTQFDIETRGPGMTEITQRVADWLAGRGDGMLTLMIRHTSASLMIQENADPNVQRDLMNWLDRLVPPADDPSMAFLRHRAEGPDDMPAHLKAALLPVSLSIPVQDGRMLLGTWQGIYLVEHRSRGRARQIAAHFSADS
jgi:secondary thiamine-phosphate synthase enzyme